MLMHFPRILGIFPENSVRRKRKASQENTLCFPVCLRKPKWFSSVCYGICVSKFLASLENTKGVFQRMAEKKKKKGLLCNPLKKKREGWIYQPINLFQSLFLRNFLRKNALRFSVTFNGLFAQLVFIKRYSTLI